VVEHSSCKRDVIGSIPIGGSSSAPFGGGALSVAGRSVVRVRQCRGCGSPLSKRSQKVYCGNACQASHRRKSSTERWLESGEARIDSHDGHYIREYLAVVAQAGCPAPLPGEHVEFADGPMQLRVGNRQLVARRASSTVAPPARASPHAAVTSAASCSDRPMSLPLSWFFSAWRRASRLDCPGAWNVAASPPAAR
jgi:hypothetical protein